MIKILLVIRLIEYMKIGIHQTASHLMGYHDNFVN